MHGSALSADRVIPEMEHPITANRMVSATTILPLSTNATATTIAITTITITTITITTITITTITITTITITTITTTTVIRTHPISLAAQI
jgi:hypothetical protein